MFLFVFFKQKTAYEMRISDWSSDVCSSYLGGMIDRFRNDVSRFDKPVGPSGSPRRRYRTIWISDVHLGTRGCNDRLLLDFLDHVDSDIFYLVGDRSEERSVGNE